ncbi:MAG: VanW family protein [Candidatus Levyibacteriota bacterium]
MFKKLLLLIPFALLFGATQAQAYDIPIPGITPVQQSEVNGQLLSQRSMSLADRYAVPSVNTAFQNNILLTFAYLAGTVKNPNQISWDGLQNPAHYEIDLKPGEVFAFHNDVLPEFANKHVITTNAHFDMQEGFVSDGYLYGDGVCHFASLINWAATDAGLKVVAPTNHDFAVIPGIDRKYGTAIYYSAGESAANEAQNLYVENTFDKPVKLVFTYNDNVLTVAVYK